MRRACDVPQSSEEVRQWPTPLAPPLIKKMFLRSSERITRTKPSVSILRFTVGGLRNMPDNPSFGVTNCDLSFCVARTRIGSGPRTMTSLRNFAIAVIGRTG